MKLKKIKYNDLNSKAQEMYNFQKVAAVLADYGFTCMWLNNDWRGADFIAVHFEDVTDMKVQLKGGFSFAENYRGKDIYICFRYKGDTYLYPHDEVLSRVEQRISDKKWKENDQRQLFFPFNDNYNSRISKSTNLCFILPS